MEPTTNKQTPMAMLQKKVSDWQTIQEAWIHNSMVIMVTSKKSSLTAIINILLYYLHGIVIQENTVTNFISCSTPWFGFELTGSSANVWNISIIKLEGAYSSLLCVTCFYLGSLHSHLTEGKTDQSSKSLDKVRLVTESKASKSLAVLLTFLILWLNIA